MQLRTSWSLALGLATAALLASAPLRAGVINGGFETGDFTGWTQFGDTSFTGVDGFAPHSGNFAAFFGPIDTGGISQTLTTVAGTAYNIQFWMQNEGDVNGDNSPNSFAVNWDGGAAEITLINAGAFGYTLYAFNAIATSATTDLTFSFTHLPAFWDLDDVTVTVPEPGSLALLALAGGMLGFARRRRGA
jgi:hypothetical protein